jgi:hypothetical protein
MFTKAIERERNNENNDFFAIVILNMNETNMKNLCLFISLDFVLVLLFMNIVEENRRQSNSMLFV